MVNRAGVVALATALVAPAHADSDKLARAREAMDAVRYDDAEPLLVAALAEGGLTAAETTEAHRLLGNALVVLGKPEEAELAYRRWLALDPRGELPTMAAAKLRRPFEAARAFISENGALSVSATRTQTSIDVTVKTDPLAMAAFASLDASRPGARVALGVGRTISLPATGGAVQVAILDARGNTLVEVAVPAFGAPVPTGVTVTLQGDEGAGPPLYRRWAVWAVPAVVLGAAGAYFVVQAQDAQDRLRAIAGTHGEFFAAEVESAEADRDRNRVLAGVFIGGGVACAVTAVVMFATRPRERRVIAISPTPGGATLQVLARF